MTVSFVTEDDRFIAGDKAGRTIMRISANQHPFCCGAVELGSLSQYLDVSEAGDKAILNRFIDWIHSEEFRGTSDEDSDQAQYGLVTVTVLKSHDYFHNLFTNAGFVKDFSWRNPNTSNKLCTYHYIYEDSKL